MCQMQNMRGICILTPTKQKQTNKNGCPKSDKFEKDEPWCYSHISEKK